MGIGHTQDFKHAYGGMGSLTKGKYSGQEDGEDLQERVEEEEEADDEAVP